MILLKINIQKIIIYVLLFFILFEDTISSFANLPIMNYIDECVILLTFIVSVLHSIHKKSINTVTLKLIFLTFIFSLIGIISCLINSEFNFFNVLYSNFLAVKFWIMVIAVSNIEYNDNFSKTIYNAITYFAILNILIGIINITLPNLYFNLFPHAERSLRYGFTAICGFFNHPGKYGWFMLTAAIINYVKYKKDKNKSSLYKVIIFVIFAALSFRTKVIISCAMLICYEILLKNIKRINLGKIAIASIGLIIFISIFAELIENTYNLYFTNNIAESARQSLMVNGVKIMNDYFPLGVGFGQYGSWYARINYSVYYRIYKMSDIYGLYPSNPMYATDTFWPMIFGETGYIGTIVFVYMLFYIYKKMKKNDLKTRDICHVGILMLLQTICESFGEPSFTSSPQCVVLAIIIGLALSNNSSTKKKEEEYGRKNDFVNNTCI